MLKGKSAVITGSTSGIGLGIARALAAEGCNVMLNGFGDAAAIDALRAALEREFSIHAAFNGAGLSQAAGCDALVADAEAQFGAVDILVNNAGIQHVAPVDEFPPERWGAVIAVNLSAAFHTIHAALPGMKRRGWGRIVNIASAHGLVASVNKVAYVAAKHGIIGMTKVVGLETAETGITCNAICPGWVLTPMVQKQIDDRAAAGGTKEDAARELLIEKQPSARFTTTGQIGAMTVFLCGEGGSNMTGSAVSMDGGWTAR